VTRRSWQPILDAAAAIVREYAYPITLRQLHYRLVSLPGLGYGTGRRDYDYLSERTAAARRCGTFPALSDQTRHIDRAPSWASPTDALDDLAELYRRDRTEGQEHLVVLGGEKRAMLAQFGEWYPDRGVPFVALSGNASQTYADEVAAFVVGDGRPAVLLYVGDLDASGEEIERDFCARCPVWEHVERVAVTEEQVAELGLPRNPGNPRDPKRAPFIARHGSLFQVEVEAIPPEVLHGLYDDALAQWWDPAAFAAVMAGEHDDRARLVELARAFGDS
jgi:hypothetical protein